MIPFIPFCPGHQETEDSFPVGNPDFFRFLRLFCGGVHEYIFRKNLTCIFLVSLFHKCLITPTSPPLPLQMPYCHVAFLAVKARLVSLED